MKIISRLLNFWFKLPEKIRFILIGGANTLVSYLTFILFIFIGARPQISLAIAWFLSSFPSYFNQRFFVFQSHEKNWGREYSKCIGTWIIGYAVNACLLVLFSKLMGIYIAQAFAIISTTVISWFLLKYFAFRSKGLNDEK